MRFLCRFLREKSRRLAFYIKRAFSATRRQMQVLKCSKFQIAGFEQQRMLLLFTILLIKLKHQFSLSVLTHTTYPVTLNLTIKLSTIDLRSSSIVE